MSSLGNYGGAVSALQASQTALETVAHNLANIDTDGYVRQQVSQTDSFYQTVATSSSSTGQVGTGTQVSEIRQVRDQFLDAAYREEASTEGYYSEQSSAVEEIENILGEVDGETSISDVIDDLWESLEELSKDPSSLETRASFVQNAQLFIEKANLIYESLSEYQEDLNTEVVETVDRINEIGESIDSLNDQIVKAEASGDDANDLRDQRNELLDELSEYVDISYSENSTGAVTVSIEGTSFVTLIGVNELGLTQASEGSDLLSPYWPQLSDEDAGDYTMLYDDDDDSDQGSLKGLLDARGDHEANYTDLEDEDSYDAISDSSVMTAQASFDQLINSIVTMINDALASESGETDGGYGLDGSQGIELFVRDDVDRYDDSGNYIEEDSSDYSTLYTCGNLSINEDILADYDLLCLSSEEGADSDNTIVQEILDNWDEESIKLNPSDGTSYNYEDYYNEYITELATDGSEYSTIESNQETVVEQIENARLSLTAVSSDEELTNMIMYQHAYNAAARVVNVIDSMMDTLINNTL